MVSRDGAENDQVNLFRLDTPCRPAAFVPAERFARRTLRQIEVRLFERNVAAFDARARDDPFVVRVDKRLQLVILHFQSGKCLSASNERAAHSFSLSTGRRSPRMGFAQRLSV